MNRPRNRQPRPPRQSQRGDAKTPNAGGEAPATPQQIAGTVPKAKQVVPGTSVFIVLKENQPTGQETQGIVQDVLTSGDHPRGIKVRLRDGQVGRVQRLDGGPWTVPSRGMVLDSVASGSGFSRRYTDVRNDDYPEEPPPRSLADFMPDLFEPGSASADLNGDATGGQDAVVCPICEVFEGDEAAVTHHIDQVHLS